MTREMIITELRNKGYVATENQVVKNGVNLNAISILVEDTNVSVNIYADSIIENGESIEEVMDSIIEIYNERKNIKFNTDEILEKNFIMNNVFIGLQKTSAEDILRKESLFDGIECYLYIKNDIQNETYSIKLNNNIISRVGLEEKDLWDVAEQNTFSESEYFSMAELVGLPEEMIPSMYVITNSSKTKGSSAIFNKKIMSEIGIKMQTNKCIVFPSSIHEMIVMPYEDGQDIEFLTCMVKEINENEVLAEERLTDRVYVMEI